MKSRLLRFVLGEYSDPIASISRIEGEYCGLTGVYAMHANIYNIEQSLVQSNGHLSE